MIGGDDATINPNGAAPRGHTTFAVINRNFLNYPIARDPRVRLIWEKSPKTGRWLADLPGNSRIQLRLPENIDKCTKHCPTGFDMNILFALLRAAQTRRS